MRGSILLPAKARRLTRVVERNRHKQMLRIQTQAVDVALFSLKITTVDSSRYRGVQSFFTIRHSRAFYTQKSGDDRCFKFPVVVFCLPTGCRRRRPAANRLIVLLWKRLAKQATYAFCAITAGITHYDPTFNSGPKHRDYGKFFFRSPFVSRM